MKIPYRNLSVRAHLFVLVLSVFLPAAGIFTWHVFQELEATRKTAYDSVKALADETAANLGRVLGNSEAVLGRLAARPLVRAIDAKNCDPILRDYVSLHPEFGTLALRDARANIICTLIPNPPAAEEVRETTWFREGMRSGKFTVGDASLSRRVGRWASISAFPVHSEGEQVVGFIFASLDLLKLNQQTFPPVSGEAVIAVIDRQDRFLLRSIDPEKWIGQSIPKHEATQVRGQREGYFTGSGADGGSQRLYAFVTVPGTGWRVLAGLPEAEALAASRARLSRSIAIGLAVLVLVLVLAYWIGSTIVNPVRHLARTAEKVSRGDINARARRRTD